MSAEGAQSGTEMQSIWVDKQERRVSALSCLLHQSRSKRYFASTSFVYITILKRYFLTIHGKEHVLSLIYIPVVSLHQQNKKELFDMFVFGTQYLRGYTR